MKKGFRKFALPLLGLLFICLAALHVQPVAGYVLQWAAWEGFEGVSAYFIKHDLSKSDDALEYASINGQANVVELLISYGASVHADRDFSLYLASKNGHLDVVETLLDHGSNVCGCAGRISLEIARSSNYPDIANLLENKRANCSMENSFSTLFDNDPMKFCRSSATTPSR